MCSSIPTYFPDGSPLFETPNMHRLASQGMRFNNAYAQPLCSASRCCLLSGQDTAARESLYMAIVSTSVPNPGLPATSGATFPYNYPTDRDHMPLAVETIAERLKAAGYVTWHAGKWHLSPAVANTAYYPDKQGFDKQLGVGGAGPPSYFGPFSGIPNMVDYNGNPAPGATGVHIGKHMQTLVQNMIDNHLATDPARPFFLYYPAYSVHSPHEAKKSLFNYFQAKLAGLPNSKHKHPVMAAQIASADQELGSMMDYLDAKGLTNNTLFIFLSDNGGLSITYESGTIVDDIGTDGIPDDAPNNVVNGTYAKTTAPVDASTRMTNMDPRRAGKGSLFEGGMRVPMIIRYPNGGISAAAASNEPVRLMDIYQTILDYTPAVAKPGYPLDGVSLKPVLRTDRLPAGPRHLRPFPEKQRNLGNAVPQRQRAQGLLRSGQLSLHHLSRRHGHDPLPVQNDRALLDGARCRDRELSTLPARSRRGGNHERRREVSGSGRCHAQAPGGILSQHRRTGSHPQSQLQRDQRELAGNHRQGLPRGRRSDA